jgi:hypothetical protein
MPASCGAVDGSALDVVSPAVGEEERETYRAGVIVSSEDMEDAGPCDAPFCGRILREAIGTAGAGGL